MTKLSVLFCAASVAAISLSAAGASRAAEAAAAADQGGGIEQIIVTGQKVSRDLQKSPLAVTVISGQGLDQANIVSAKDLDATAPGLVVTNTPSNPLALTIRGAGYEGIENNSAQPGVSFNQNGVYITSPTALSTDFLDVDQLEVLRGPQGTVLGQNSDGGAINITTVKPVLGAYKGSGEVSYGSFNLDRLRLIGNLPIGDSAALRVAFQQEAHDGYSQATDVPGKPNYQLGDENAYNGRVDFLWKPTAPLTVEVWGETFQNNSNGDAYKNIYDPNPNPYRVSQDIASKLHEQTDIAATKVSYDFGWATANFIASYQHGKLISAPEDLDKLDFALGIKDFGVHDLDEVNSREGDSYTQEIDLVSAPGGKLDWIVGAFSLEQTYHETVLEFQYTNPNAVLPTNVSNPGAVFATGALAFESVDTQRLDSSSLYAQGTYHFTDKLRFTGGVRATTDNQKGLVAVFFNPNVDLTAKFTALTGKADLEYDLAPASTIYGMWSSGIKPGGTNLNPGAEAIPEVFKPEQNDAIELGSKNQFFDHKLRLNLAAFYNMINNFQTDSEDPIPFKGGLTNVKALHTYGLEGEFTALLPYDFRLDGNFATMGGRVDSHEQLFDPEVAQHINLIDGGAFVGSDLADRAAAFASSAGQLYGKTPPKIPDFSANIGLSQTLHLDNGGTFTSHLKYSFRDSYFFRIYNNPATDTVPVLRQWDLDFTYRFPSKKLHVDFLITNLTDTASVNARYTDNFGVGAVSNYYVPPRQFIGRIGYSF